MLKNDSSHVLTVKELSDYLKVHPSTIYRQLKRGRLPAFKVGSDWRFNIESIDRWRLEQDTFKELWERRTRSGGLGGRKEGSHAEGRPQGRPAWLTTGRHERRRASRKKYASDYTSGTDHGHVAGDPLGARHAREGQSRSNGEGSWCPLKGGRAVVHRDECRACCAAGSE